jgi:hypothetical protein
MATVRAYAAEMDSATALIPFLQGSTYRNFAALVAKAYGINGW